MEGLNFREKLQDKMDNYVHLVYLITKRFPREEMYGVTSQLRRSALSVILNFIEGYARRTNNSINIYKHFLNISYGSLKESEYLICFSHKEKYLSDFDFKTLSSLANETGAMLYKIKESS
jgi:four helix bundle protein